MDVVRCPFCRRETFGKDGDACTVCEGILVMVAPTIEVIDAILDAGIGFHVALLLLEKREEPLPIE